MPAKKNKRNSKPKSVHKKISHSHPLNQIQNQKTKPSNTITVTDLSAMEDNTSNGNAEQDYKEVVVDDAVAGEEEHVSVLDKVAAAAEKIFDRSSSSSSSSDDEAEPPKPDPEPEAEPPPEDNAAEELACDDEKAENSEPIAETLLEEDASASAVTPIAEAVAEAVVEAKEEEVVSKVVEESVVVESPQVVPEAEPSEPCGVVGVTRESLQRESWKSCCGLFEVLRRSESQR